MEFNLIKINYGDKLSGKSTTKVFKTKKPNLVLVWEDFNSNVNQWIGDNFDSNNQSQRNYCLTLNWIGMYLCFQVH